MTKYTLIIFGVITCAVLSTASAHDLRNASGQAVSHGHYGACGPNGCPTPDADFERAVSFRSSDRLYSGTGAWNCHGRTFDRRRSWVPLAEGFISGDLTAVCPLAPQAGDVVVWYSNGRTSHTTTITGAWNGNSTRVMSKYGTQGQYQHSLSNAVRVYGAYGTIVRFRVQPVYQTMNEKHEKVASTSDSSRSCQVGDPFGSSGADRFVRAAEQMSWHDAILEAQKIHREEFPKVIEALARMPDRARELYKSATTTEQEVDALIRDLADDSHYVVLGAYEMPSLGAPFFENLESGSILIDVAMESPQNATVVVDRLTKLYEEHSATRIVSTNSTLADYVRGSSIYYLGLVQSDSERALFKQKVLDSLSTSSKRFVHTSYTRFFAEQL